jgi:ABC-type multidrug transport system ATPase subunit
VNAPRLAVSGVSRRFGRRAVLHGVSFAVAAGEIVGVVGENGAGKSTLLRIVAGLLRPTAGAVHVAGTLGYCDQEPHLAPDLTVSEHFAYFARAYGLRSSRAWHEAREALLEQLGFGRYAGYRVSQLSGGTRQKLHLSLALLHDPDLLVLDEPYSAFDWDTYLRFWTLAETRQRQGAAILIVSHLVHERERFTRVHALDGGSLQ